jgi:hypothetical protein
MGKRFGTESSYSLLLQRQLAAALAVAPLTTGEMQAVTARDVSGARGRAAPFDDWASDSLSQTLTDWLDRVDDERDSAPPLATELPWIARRFLSERWMRAAETSHGAIGAFARTTLNLMNLDAPLELLTGTQRAGLSTMRDAELALDLASRFVGERLALAETPLGESVPLVASLPELAICVFHEHCVGPTLRAVRVAEQLRHTSSADSTRALGKRLGTQTEVAELGWATLAWALRVGGDGVRGALLSAAGAAQQQIRGWIPDPVPAALPRAALQRYGVLSPRREQEGHLRAWRKVVLPAIEELLRHHVVP